MSGQDNMTNWLVSRETGEKIDHLIVQCLFG